MNRCCSSQANSRTALAEFNTSVMFIARFSARWKSRIAGSVGTSISTVTQRVRSPGGMKAVSIKKQLKDCRRLTISYRRRPGPGLGRSRGFPSFLRFSRQRTLHTKYGGDQEVVHFIEELKQGFHGFRLFYGGLCESAVC